MVLQNTEELIENVVRRKLDGGILIKDENSVLILQKLIGIIGDDKGSNYIYLYYNTESDRSEVKEFVLKSDYNSRISIINNLEYFKSQKYFYPEIYVGLDMAEVNRVEIIKEDQINILREDLESYYEKRDLRNIRLDNTFRLLSITQGVGKDIPRDIEEALQPFGVKCKYLQKDGDSYVNEYSYHWDEFSYLQLLNEFHPDAIFTIFNTKNAARYYIPRKMLVFTMLDIMANLLTAPRLFLRSLDPYNIIFLPGMTMKQISKLEEEDIIRWDRNTVEYLFTCNKNLYCDYTLTQEESDYYGADVCVVGGYHSTDQFWIELERQGHMKYMHDTNRYNTVINSYRQIIDKIQERYGKTKTLIDDTIWFASIIEEAFVKNGMLLTKDEISQHSWVFMSLYQSFYLTGIYLESLLELPFKVKFWGADYTKLKRFSDYAMGSVHNGVELAKVYSSSKICIGTNVMNGMHQILDLII